MYGHRTIFIKDTHRGLRYVDGVLDGVLEAGRHKIPRAWRMGSYRSPVVEIHLVDVRERDLTIKGQEILTADKVALRVSIVVQFRVVDPVLALHRVEDYEIRIYTDVQLAARRSLASMSLDEILTNRNRLSEEILADVKEAAQGYGVEILRAAVKDLVFPGEPPGDHEPGPRGRAPDGGRADRGPGPGRVPADPGRDAGRVPPDRGRGHGPGAAQARRDGGLRPPDAEAGRARGPARAAGGRGGLCGPPGPCSGSRSSRPWASSPSRPVPASTSASTSTAPCVRSVTRPRADGPAPSGGPGLSLPSIHRRGPWRRAAAPGRKVSTPLVPTDRPPRSGVASRAR